MGPPAAPVRVVLDTNTAVSALLFPARRLSWMAAAWMAGRIEPLVSAATADELIRVLAHPKFRLDDDDVRAVLAGYLPFSEVVDTSPGAPAACRKSSMTRATSSTQTGISPEH